MNLKDVYNVYLSEPFIKSGSIISWLTISISTQEVIKQVELIGN